MKKEIDLKALRLALYGNRARLELTRAQKDVWPYFVEALTVALGYPPELCVPLVTWHPPLPKKGEES